MTARSRNILLALAALGLAASTYGVYVHYRLLTDPTYSSLCDISASFSCQQVFQSQYGTVLGLPVAAGGAIWSALVLLLAGAGMRNPGSEQAERVSGYLFVLATLGLAAVFYFAYASFVVLRQLCPVCLTMYVSVVGIFIVAAKSKAPLGALPSRLGHDLSALGRSTTAVALTIAWLAASVGLILWFPRDQVVTAAEAEAQVQEAPVPVEVLSPDIIAELQTWYDSQPRVAEVLPTGGAKVLMVKFNDYQCPSCRQTWALYRDIIAKYEASHPGEFVFQNRDFPLESECGAGGYHSAACEAAAAVRMAREKNRHKEVERAIFSRQSADMTRDDVKEALEEAGQISGAEFDERYPKMLEAIRADVQLGQKLEVSGTPTFYINGVKIPSLRAASMDALIAHALRKAGAAS
jgi:uncharacterized membrane protein/protein-disulfide isomerase